LLIFIVPEAASPRGIPVATGTIDIMSTLAVYCSVVVPVISIITAIAVFGYLHNHKAAGFVSSLPIRRIGLYVTNWLSGLTLMLAPALLTGVLYGLLLIGRPVPSGDFLRWIGALLASHLIFFSIAVFCSFLTGNPVMQAFLYGLFNFMSYAFYLLSKSVATLLVFGYSVPDASPVYTLAVLLTPPVAMLRTIQLMAPQRMFSFGFEAYIPTAALHWMLYLIFTALMIVFGYLLYHRRRIEDAGEVIAHRPVKSVFKYLIGACFGALMALIVTLFASRGSMVSIIEKTTVFSVSVMFFGALGCLFSEMLIRKRLRVWKTAHKGIIVFVASVIAVTLFIRFDGIGYERRVPDPKDVTAVSLTSQLRPFSPPLHRSAEDINLRFVPSGEHWSLLWSYFERQQSLGLPVFDDAIIHEIKLRTPNYFESPEAIASAVKLHQAIVDDRRNLGELQDNEGFWWYYLTYTLKDGSVMTRDYLLPASVKPMHDLVSLMLELYNQPEAIDKRNRFIDLPDEAVLRATVTPVSGDFWVFVPDYPSRLYEGRVRLTEDEISTILAALKKDHTAGTLGLISHADLLLEHYYYDNIAIPGIINILLDSTVAGVPTAFYQDSIYYEDENEISGLLLSITLHEDHANTIQALKDLGLLAG